METNLYKPVKRFLESLGFEAKGWGGQLLVAIVLGLGSFVALNLVASMLAQLLPHEKANPFMALLSQRGNILPWLAIVWFSSFVEDA